MPVVRGSHDLALEGARGGEEPLEFDARNHIRVTAVAVLGLEGWIKFIKPRGEDDRTDLDLHVLVSQRMVDGLGLAGLDALHALRASPALEAPLRFLDGLFRREGRLHRFDHIGRRFTLHPEVVGDVASQRRELASFSFATLVKVLAPEEPID
jgi:hypothetical protein